MCIRDSHYTQEQAHRAIFSGGLRIYSAQDPSLQSICDEEFSNPANFPAGSFAETPQASLVLMDQHTGLVRALVGGRGEKKASLTLNRATDMPVSYTHLDVYKRQLRHRDNRCRCHGISIDGLGLRFFSCRVTVVLDSSAVFQIVRQTNRQQHFPVSGI